jgi:hypothetical protein
MEYVGEFEVTANCCESGCAMCGGTGIVCVEINTIDAAGAFAEAMAAEAAQRAESPLWWPPKN